MKDKKKRVRLALEDLPDCWPAALKGCRLGAVLHPASVLPSLQHSAYALKDLDGSLFQLKALFGPQHGFMGETQDNMIEWKGFLHPRFGIPVHSLYGEHREPTQEMLQGLDAVLVDLQDVGARYYTFIWTLFLVMQACENHGIPVVVVDRPNPINGVAVEGPKLDPAYRSFVGLHSIVVRHGLTIGELAQLFRKEAFPDSYLEILPMQGWERGMWYDETGLPWVMPSPNMPTLDTATVYPGMCLFEATNVSEGRGTTRPFEVFGAPWIDAFDFCGKLNAVGLPGVHFREAHFLPTFHKFQGEICHGAQFHVVDRDSFQPWTSALEILKLLQAHYGEHFAWKKPPYEYEVHKLPIEILVGGPLEPLGLHK